MGSCGSEATILTSTIFTMAKLRSILLPKINKTPYCLISKVNIYFIIMSNVYASSSLVKLLSNAY